MKRRRLQLCLAIMRGNLWLYVGAIAALLVQVLLGFIAPRIQGWTIDSIIDTVPLDAPRFVADLAARLGGREYLVRNLWICGAAMVATTALNGVFSYFYSRWSAQASESIAKNTRDRMYDHLQKLSYGYHVKAETGDLLQRCSSDVETVRRFLATQLMQIVRSVSLMVLALCIMLPLSWKLTLVALVVVPPIFIFSMLYFRRVISTFRDADEAEGEMSAVLQESLTGMRVVRAFGRQKYEIDKFLEKSGAFRDKIFRLLNIEAKFWAISDGMAYLQKAGLIIAGLYFILAGQLTVGTLVVFISYENYLLWPVRQLGRVLADMGKAMVSLERIDEVLRTPQETEDASGKLTPDLKGDIVFSDVHFEYEQGKPVLDGVSFVAKQGQTTAILGATGTGKSTLMLLLQRLYDYQSGSITINGTELRDIDKTHLRTHVGIVLQEPFLYSRSVRDNIAITDPAMPDERVFQAARTAAVHDVIEGFDKGYETMVGERGVTLSGGQKQRVSIARTLLKDNDILIFDDSLSAVDTETDARIRAELKARRDGATTFIIAHRITTLMHADKIIVLEGGRVAQEGVHSQLIAQDGLYKRIYDIQSALEQELGDHIPA